MTKKKRENATCNFADARTHDHFSYLSTGTGGGHPLHEIMIEPD
jgi:hypothetical protein